MIIPVLMLVARGLISRDTTVGAMGMHVAIIVLLGLVAFFSAGLSAVKPYASSISISVGLVANTALIWGAFLEASVEPGIIYSILGRVAVVMMIVMVAMVLHPLQMLFLCLATQGMFVLLSEVAGASFLPSDLWSTIADVSVILTIFTLLITAVAAVRYTQIHQVYQSHQRNCRRPMSCGRQSLICSWPKTPPPWEGLPAL